MIYSKITYINYSVKTLICITCIFWDVEHVWGGCIIMSNLRWQTLRHYIKSPSAARLHVLGAVPISVSLVPTEQCTEKTSLPLFTHTNETSAFSYLALTKTQLSKLLKLDYFSDTKYFNLQSNKMILKGSFTQKWRFCYHSLTLMWFQTCDFHPSVDHKRRFFEELFWWPLTSITWGGGEHLHNMLSFWIHENKKQMFSIMFWLLFFVQWKWIVTGLSRSKTVIKMYKTNTCC